MATKGNRYTDTNPYAHIRQKGNEDWFMYWLHEDADFQKSVEALNNYYDEHSVHDPVYLKGLEPDLAEEVVRMQQAIISQYHITRDDLLLTMRDTFTTVSYDCPFWNVQTLKNGNLVVEIPVTMKRADYLAAWPEIKSWLKQPDEESPASRNRAADDMRLVYAVYKARTNQLTFREIFELYCNGKLPAYDNGPTNQFNSEDSLERYYNKYCPEKRKPAS